MSFLVKSSLPVKLSQGLATVTLRSGGPSIRSAFSGLDQLRAATKNAVCWPSIPHNPIPQVACRAELASSQGDPDEDGDVGVHLGVGDVLAAGGGELLEPVAGADLGAVVIHGDADAE